MRACTRFPWRCTNGGGLFTSHGEHDHLKLPTATGFFHIPQGRQRVVPGKAIIWNDPQRSDQPPGQRPAVIAAAMCFPRKGTSLGFDAWVGGVWSKPLVLSVAANE